MPTPQTPAAAYQSAAGPLRSQLEEAARRGPRHFAQTMPGPAQVLKVLELADKAVAQTKS